MRFEKFCDPGIAHLCQFTNPSLANFVTKSWHGAFYCTMFFNFHAFAVNVMSSFSTKLRLSPQLLMQFFPYNMNKLTDHCSCSIKHFLHPFHSNLDILPSGVGAASHFPVSESEYLQRVSLTSLSVLLLSAAGLATTLPLG